MRTRLLPWVALLGLAAVVRPAWPSEDGAARPTVVVRLGPLDRLTADARYLVELAGREEVGKQLEGLVKSRTGPKGFEGIDTGKPLGLYARVGDKGLADSTVVALLPIADQAAFLDFLDRLEVKAERGKDG